MRLAIPTLFILALLTAPLGISAGVQEYLASNYDFLSSSELQYFRNITIAGTPWSNLDGLSATVSNGILTIQSTGSVDGFLVYDEAINGRVVVRLSGDGYVGVLASIALNQSSVEGYVVDVVASLVSLYAINGSSKVLVNTFTIPNADEITVLADGTGVIHIQVETIKIYEAYIGIAQLGLGVKAGGTSSYDMLTVYDVSYLQGTTTKSLGRATITSSDRIAEFTLNEDIQRGSKIYIRVIDTSDVYPRYYIISDQLPSQTFWKNSADRQNAIKFGIITPSQREVVVTVNDDLRAGSKIYVGISTFANFQWEIELLVDAEAPPPSDGGGDNSGGNGDQNSGSGDDNVVRDNASDEASDEWFSDKNTKYILAGLGALVVVFAIAMIATRGGR